MIKPCPFCQSTNIKYSLKTSGRFTIIYHACFYCADCHTYGPRVRSKGFENNDYSRRVEAENNDALKEEALLKWNTRG